MKKKILPILGMAALFAAASCSVENMDENPVSGIRKVAMTFNAESQSVGTKTSIDPNAGNAVYWTAGDAISVFPTGGGNEKFVLEGEGGSASGSFTGEAAPDAAPYYALYPYDASATLSGTTINATLPSTQYSTTAGTFDTMLAPAVAVSDDSNNLSFSHVAGLLELNFTNLDGTIKEIQLKAAEKSMAGAYTVRMSGDTFSAVSASSDESPVSVRLTAKDGGNLAENGPYYLVLLPGTYADVQLFITLDNGTSYMVGTLGTFEVKAGELRPQTVDASKATANSDGLYGLFMAGADIYIGGKAYSSADIETFGTVNHVTAENASGTTFSSSGIYFIDSDASITYSQSTALNKVLLIGNDPEKRSTINFSKNIIALNSSDGHFACYNIDFDGRNSSTNYIMASNYNGNFNYIAFDNCRFQTTTNDTRSFPVINLGTASSDNGGTSRGVETIIVENCIYTTPATTNNRFFIHMTTASGVSMNTAAMGSMTFRNNLIYSTDPSEGLASNFKFFNGVNNSVDEVIIDNNTFINVCTSTTYMVYATSIDYIELQNNIFYAPTISNNVGFFRSAEAVLAGLIQNNISYIPNPGTGTNNNGTFTYSIYAYWGSQADFEYDEIELLQETPFETAFDISSESYTLKPEYASYGAQR